MKAGFPDIQLPFIDPNTGIINQTWLQLLQAIFLRTGGGTGSASFTSGDLKAAAYGGSIDGWLICNGAAVSRTTYRDLFGAIGTTWGAGDGSTTFNVPDLRDKIPLGASGTKVLGSSGGASTLTIAQANLPNVSLAVTDPGHTHAVTDPQHTHTVTDPGHKHTALTATSTNTAGADPGTAVAGDTSTDVTDITIDPASTGVTVDSATTGISVSLGGSGTAANIQNKYAAVTWYIKT